MLPTVAVLLFDQMPDILDNRLSDSVNETLLLHPQGITAEQIAHQRQLKPTTVYTHLAEAIEAGLADAREVLPLDDAQYHEIAATMELLNICEEGRLKPLYEELDQAYDYGILKCVLAAECLG